MPARVIPGLGRVRWAKRPRGRRATKGEAIAYWAGLVARLKGETIMAPRRKESEPATAWKTVPSDLNLWEPKTKGQELVGLVTQVNPAGKFGLQVKIMEPDGTIYTLPSHKVLQGRLESVPGGLRPLKTCLRVVYDGREKSANYQTPMEMYTVQYRERGADDLWDVPAEVAH